MAGLIPDNASLNATPIPRINLMYAFPQFSGVTFQNVPIGSHPNAAHVAPGSAKPDNPTIPKWFNTDPWNDASGKRVAAQEADTLKTFPLRFSDARLPGYHNRDVSASKVFPIYERVKLHFKFEAVNALNHPWFTGIASVDATSAQFERLNPTRNNLPRFLKLGLVLRW